MGFGRKSSHVIGGGGGGHGEDLVLTPLLDLLMALIPFLIISSAITQVNIVEVGLSKPVASPVTEKKSDFDLLLEVSAKSVAVKMKGKVVRSVSVGQDSAWVKELHKELVQLKKAHLDEQKLRLEPKGDVKLEVLMAIMDSARTLESADGEITRTNEKGERVKLKYLFPNVILKGVYGS